MVEELKMSMTDTQKARLRKYLDSFSFNNGGCLLCNQGCFQFYFDTGLQRVDEDKSYPVVTLYGLCRTCDRQQQEKMIDQKLDIFRKEGLLKVIVDKGDVQSPVSPKVLILHFVPEPKKKITMAEIRRRSNPFNRKLGW